MKFKIDTNSKTLTILEDSISILELHNIVTEYIKHPKEWTLIVNEPPLTNNSDWLKNFPNIVPCTNPFVETPPQTHEWNPNYGPMYTTSSKIGIIEENIKNTEPSIQQ